MLWGNYKQLINFQLHSTITIPKYCIILSAVSEVFFLNLLTVGEGGGSGVWSPYEIYIRMTINTRLTISQGDPDSKIDYNQNSTLVHIYSLIPLVCWKKKYTLYKKSLKFIQFYGMGLWKSRMSTQNAGPDLDYL